MCLILFHSDLLTWMSGVQVSVSSQEVASDVSSAETLLAKHKVRPVHKNCD